jgi:hypothetical protein
MVPYSVKTCVFTRVAPHTKAKGSQSAVPYSAKTYVFYTRSTAYKKSVAPDRRSLIQQKVYAFYTRSTAYKKQEAPNRLSLTQ